MADHPLRPATDRCLGEPLPHQQANPTQAPPTARGPKIPRFPPWGVCGISPDFSGLSPSVGQIPTCYSPVRHSSAPRSSRRNPSGPLPFDLHVLGLPPAFNLSQDQTLQFKIVSIGQSKTLSSGVPLFYPDLHPDKIKTRYCCSELDAKAPTQSACKLLKIGARPRGFARRGRDYT